MTGPGKDPKFKQQFLLNVYCFHTIIKSKTRQSNHLKLGTTVDWSPFCSWIPHRAVAHFPFFPTFAGSPSAFVSFVSVLQNFIGYAKWNPKNSSLIRHGFISLAGYRKGCFIPVYPSCVTAFESTNPVPGNSTGRLTSNSVASQSRPCIYCLELLLLNHWHDHWNAGLPPHLMWEMRPRGHHLRPLQVLRWCRHPLPANGDPWLFWD